MEQVTAAKTEDRLLKPSDVARKLSVTKCTLEKWRRCGVGPPWVKLLPGRSGHIRYSDHGLSRFIKEAIGSDG